MRQLIFISFFVLLSSSRAPATTLEYGLGELFPTDSNQNIAYHQSAVEKISSFTLLLPFNEETQEIVWSSVVGYEQQQLITTQQDSLSTKLPNGEVDYLKLGIEGRFRLAKPLLESMVRLVYQNELNKKNFSGKEFTHREGLNFEGGIQMAYWPTRVIVPTPVLGFKFISNLEKKNISGALLTFGVRWK